MRVKMLAGNWKMNKLNAELPALFSEFIGAVGLKEREDLTERVDMLFAVPFTLLAKANEIAGPLGIRVAAQNFHHEPQGAYTGEISIGMLKELGISASLIGHSERRQYFGETDEAVARKVRVALEQGLMPIACVGETLAERERGQTEAVIARQLSAILDVVQDLRDLVIAYEPVWAIGTGRSATNAQAQDVHHFIRQLIAKKHSQPVADRLRVLYGGSANPSNIASLLAEPDIDGALVGGASLKPLDFASMVRAAL